MDVFPLFLHVYYYNYTKVLIKTSGIFFTFGKAVRSMRESTFCFLSPFEKNVIYGTLILLTNVTSRGMWLPRA